MWFWRRGSDLGIDLGTATVLVYVKGKGDFWYSIGNVNELNT